MDELVAMRAVAGGALVGHQISALRSHLPAGVDVEIKV